MVKRMTDHEIRVRAFEFSQDYLSWRARKFAPHAAEYPGEADKLAAAFRLAMKEAKSSSKRYGVDCGACKSCMGM